MQVPVTVTVARRAYGLTTSTGDTPVCTWCSSLPVTGMTWQQASELASLLGGRLPTSPEWEWMAGRGVRHYPWGGDEPCEADGVVRANIRGVGPDAVTPVGAVMAGATPDGLLDVAGNVWEWTATAVPSGFVIRGGSYRALPLYTRCDFVTEAPGSLVSPGIGLRVVRDR
jgi:formylglycine-generating enzyme required for sulfatase activity